MPFDVRDFPGLPPDERSASRGNRRLVALWLFGVCAAILVMVVLGGVTRLTGSGLSIMEWAPVRGVLPPLNHQDWDKLFALYKQIPQYKIIHQGFGLDGFKHIFWLEWMHRLWGRLIGVFFLLPLAFFWSTGRIERRLRPRLAVIFVLGGLQGAVGWFMVASGYIPDSTAVAPARLVVHLALAVLLYGAILWTGLGVLWPAPIPSPRAGLLRSLALACAVSVLFTMLAGGFVAGTHAGLVYNTFPLMDGHWVPADYARQEPFWRNLTGNLATVQFNHRVLATLSALTAAAAALVACTQVVRAATRVAVLVMTGAVALQYALGVATLLRVVPVPLAAAHQANALLALTAALVAVHRLRPVPATSARTARADVVP